MSESKGKSFWQTLPGIITSLAALITAIGGCVAVVFGIPAISNRIFGDAPTPTAIQVPPSTETPPAILGDWRNEDPNTGGITRIKISADGGNYQVETWGACTPTDCYWNEVDGAQYYVTNSGDTSMTIVWIFSFKENTLKLNVIGDDRLQVDAHNHFTDNSGRDDSDFTGYFVK